MSPMWRGELALSSPSAAAIATAGNLLRLGSLAIMSRLVQVLRVMRMGGTGSPREPASG